MRLAAIDREMGTLRTRLNLLETQKAMLMTRLMAALVAGALPSTQAARRSDHGIPRCGASASVIPEPPTGSVERSSVRPPRNLVEGRAPYGFAARVRMLAHRSIALANRPLERAEIIDDIVASGTQLPKAFLPQKIGRVLARDEELVSRRGEGYTLTEAALSREMRLIRDEGAVVGTMSMDAAVPVGSDDEMDDPMPEDHGPGPG